MREENIKVIIIFSIILSLAFSVNAQRRLKIEKREIRWKEFSVETYGAQMWGKNYHIFDPTMGVNAELNLNGFCFGIGYSKFKPIQDTFYIADNSLIGYGTMIFNDYLVIPVYIGWDWGIEFFNRVRLLGSFHGGGFLVSNKFEEHTDSHDGSESYRGFKYNLSPKLTIKVLLNKHFSIYGFYRYSFLFGLADAYGSVNSIHNFSSIGGGISYDFNNRRK